MSDCTPTYRSLIPKLLRSVAGLAVACTMVSCINEDLSDCGSYCDFNFRFTTELEMEWIVNSHLSAGAAEQEMSRLLIEKLDPVFSGKIYHLEVPFFESESRATAHYETVEAGGGNEVNYSLYLPQGTYRHHPVANAVTEPACGTTTCDCLDNYTVRYVDGDTIDSFTYGIYHGALDVGIDGSDKNMHIPLCMTNSAVALVLSPAVDSVESYIVNTAAGFSSADSTYDFSTPTVVRTSRLLTDSLVASYGVCFPSRGEEDAVQRAASDEEYWQMHVYVTRGGKTTRNVLSIRESLAAGEPKILKARISDDGEIIYTGTEVSVSVSLDWKPGGDHDIEI